VLSFLFDLIGTFVGFVHSLISVHVYLSNAGVAVAFAIVSASG